ncbi:hypothetical protein E2C01_033348 [Portunus trituberculatus]|uniref:Uncharacterized protein n=1 Tax=Portunus trituberculatus TaxID=210409 RepID=A0A5B7F3H8_PORTR|nr:hypothetical protein [Portunus trituberculatus]
MEQVSTRRYREYPGHSTLGNVTGLGDPGGGWKRSCLLQLRRFDRPCVGCAGASQPRHTALRFHHSE